jgi:hypothetical protein
MNTATVTMQLDPSTAALLRALQLKAAAQGTSLNALLKPLAEPINEAATESTDGSLETTESRENKFQSAVQWLAENKTAYLNQWVALDGNTLLATGTDGKEVYAQALAAGVTSPLLHQITESDDLPFGGW